MTKSGLATIAVFALALSFGAMACDSTPSHGSGANSAADAEHSLIGSTVPNFAAQTLNGKGRASVKPNEGKVMVVDFWATWCEPCKKAFPKLQELYVKHKASGMEIVAVSEDDHDDAVRSFGETFGANFPIVWDDGKTIASRWKPKSMPSTFIVDRKGVVRFAHFGYHDGEEAEIEQEVKSLL